MNYAKLFVLLFGIATLVVACSESSTMMTSPSPMPSSSSTVMQGASMSVSEPKVLVGGVPVQGTLTRGSGEPALFEVRVNASQGLSTIGRVVMEYTQPGPNHHGGSMMGGYNGTVLCYDDGTHGDDIPGDGVFHYMDPDDQIGCHGLDAPHGEYHYSFWAEDMIGQRSNTVSVTIVRE